ncbi:hypothetical protein [Paraburkholderia azotifigens]|uniref:Uncharacterized protein n=1 Tax=Paraburkholderia azotifigens TaxID=2057004 RepID=A0A5C6VRY1_9BURK|nr:hypothetical protein [Paraburkholderia azotifigens]TXC86168.1 hypothetical protein FRZ40_00465 [Paraburkholderia azotifigens]
MSMDVSQTTAMQTTAFGGHRSSGAGDARGSQDQQAQTFSPDCGGGQSGCSGGGGGGGDMLKDLMQLLKAVMSLFSGGLGGMMG